MTEKEDCPVQEQTCIARMATLDEKIKSIKIAIYISGATVTVILGVVEVLLRLWKP